MDTAEAGSSGRDHKVVIGIDGGGSFTRALAADLSGRVLAYAETGPASPDKSHDAEQNVRQAILEVLSRAGKRPAEVAALVAGIAGLNRPEDQVWAERFTAVPGLNGVRIHVNDAAVAHAGALGSRPGIIAIAGTGSAVYGVTPGGRPHFNTDFHHYARAAARHLAQDAVFLLLAGEAAPDDAPLLSAVLRYWEQPDLAGLRELGARGFDPDPFTCSRRFAELAPRVTEAAGRGEPLALRVCSQAAETLATGIRLVGACFPDGPVSVALIGAVARSPVVTEALRLRLEEGRGGYQLVEPQHSCAEGAVLMALRAAGVPLTGEVLGALQRDVG